MAGASDAIFRADPPDALVRVSLGAIDALYHRPSGATHLVAAPVPQILEALAEGPTDAASLGRRLAARFELADGEADLLPALAARLAELEALGLVRREPGVAR